VTPNVDGSLGHYERLGYVVTLAMAGSILLMARVNSLVMGDRGPKAVPAMAGSVTPSLQPPPAD
jgi:hypothetical protein